MIECKKNRYVISKQTLDLVLRALERHWFSECGCRDNDDVILAQEMLEKEIDIRDEWGAA